MSTLHWRLLLIIIVSLPFIDVLTMLTESFTVSFGAFFRMGFIVILFFYLANYFFTKSKWMFLLFFLSMFVVTMTFVLNYSLKDPFYFYDEIQFTMKTIFMLLIIFYLFVVNDAINERKLDEQQYERFYQAVNLNGSFVSLLYWIAVFSGTSLRSYPNDNAGLSGWYFAANELSVIVLILFTFALQQLMKVQSWQTVFLPFLLLFIAPMIGTKTAFFGTSLIAILFLIFFVRNLSVKVLLYLVPLTIFYFVILYNSAIMYNLQPEKFSSEDRKLLIEQQANNSLLSSRDMYAMQLKNDFVHASLLRKLFGLGYAGDYKAAPKMAEMDFYDLFFSYGIIGTIVILIPIVLLLIRAISIQLKDTYILFMFTLMLCLGVSFFVGHVLFAPAVMSYVALLMIGLMIEKERKKHAL